MAANTGLILNVAVNYGGRLEMVQAVRRLADDVKAGRCDVGDIDEDRLSSYLYTAPDNDVDLLIRPGDDKRVSNFLLWQMAYAEFGLRLFAGLILRKKRLSKLSHPFKAENVALAV